jgi:hypothetical protein
VTDFSAALMPPDLGSFAKLKFFIFRMKVVVIGGIYLGASCFLPKGLLLGFSV